MHRFALAPQGGGTLVTCQESMGGRPAAILYGSAKLQAAMDASLALFKAACER